MSLVRRFVLVFTLALAVLTLQPSSVEAHGRGFLLIPNQEPSRPLPILDGNCGTEYPNGVYNAIRYRPAFNVDPAPFYIMQQGDILFGCVRNLPLGVGTTSRMAFSFDMAHDGGTAPDSDDWRFAVSQSGNTTVETGTGSGWSLPTAPPVSNFLAAVTTGDLTWNAEFRLHVSALGGIRPFTLFGLTVNQLDVQSVGDSHSWYTTHNPNIPNTWGDGSGVSAWNGIAPLQMDVWRVTQGLDYDSTANVAYRRIAHKDTLVRTQLWTNGMIAPIASGRCEIQRYYTLNGDTPTFSLGAVQTVPISFTSTPTVNAVPFGFFNGSPTVDCWVPGDTVAVPGIYQITLYARLQGSATTQSFNLGQNWFYSTTDYEVMLFRRENPTNDPNFVPWTAPYTTVLIDSLAESQRMLPLRRGVGGITTTSTGDFSPFAGLRYYMHPSIYTCGIQAPGPCDAAARAFNRSALQFLNWQRYLYIGNIGLFPDYLDQDLMGVAFTATGGGQAQPWSGGYCSIGIGSDADLNGATGSVAAHELSHCLGQVRSSSPHSDGGSHSTTSSIIYAAGKPMVNMRTRMNQWTPLALMNPTVTNTGFHINEGWEWNNIRTSLPNRPAPAPRGGEPVFWLSGSVSLSDTVAIAASRRATDYPFAVQQDDPNSNWGLYFFNGSGSEVGRTRFAMDFEGEDGTPPTWQGLTVFATLPGDAVRVELRKGNTPLWQLGFSANAPIVNTVNAIPDDDVVFVNWEATDADLGDILHYNLYYQANAQTPPDLIAQGLSAPPYNFDATQTGGTLGGIITVEASDGFNSGTKLSTPFDLTTKPPIVTINNPTAGQQLVAAQRVQLTALAYDYEDGLLDGVAVRWVSTIDGELGEGASLTTSLSAGVHILTVTAKDSAGNTAVATVDVIVQADSDADGLPDDYELLHVCLDPAIADSHLDPDVDSLASYGESQWSSDPCLHDSDNDNVPDGEEVQYGGNPIDGAIQPPSPTLFMNVAPIPLTCDAPTASRTVTATTSWSATTSEAWLSATDGSSTGQVSVTADCTTLPDGTYATELLISNGNEQRIIPVTLTVGNKMLYLPLIRRD